MSEFYVTKYALSGGIQRVTGKLTNDGQYVTYEPHGFARYGRDAFINSMEAQADAEKRRVAKIASLRKQIAKLEKLTFATPTTETRA